MVHLVEMISKNAPLVPITLRSRISDSWTLPRAITRLGSQRGNLNPLNPLRLSVCSPRLAGPRAHHRRSSISSSLPLHRALNPGRCGIQDGVAWLMPHNFRIGRAPAADSEPGLPESSAVRSLGYPLPPSRKKAAPPPRPALPSGVEGSAAAQPFPQARTRLALAYLQPQARRRRRGKDANSGRGGRGGGFATRTHTHARSRRVFVRLETRPSRSVPLFRRWRQANAFPRQTSGAF
mmetsp:Transcript_46435/g.123184  ORF Transcript_46435/g.123184 Transcript_46435/m.123184 type:complete len:236 (+) Transcript_46435:473-1180(+)